MVEPEGGGPGAYRRVDEQAGILPAKVVGDGKKGHEMGADAVSGLVPLEIGHLVLLHQVGAAFFEPLVILGAGKVESRGVSRENAFVLGMLNPLFRAEIPSQRRNPDAEAGRNLPDRLDYRFKPVREFFGGGLPEVFINVVPAVIQHEAVQPDVAGTQFLPVFPGCLDERLFRGVQAVVIPAVVMQKLTVGRSPFPFQIIKEPAAKLVLRPYAQHRGERLGVTAAHGKVAVKPDGSRSSGGLGPGYGKFNAGKRAFPLADQWAARYGALHGQGGILQINQLDFLQIHLLGRFNPVGFLDVGGTLPQFRLPVNRQPAVFVPENGGNNGPFQPFPQAEAGGMPFQCADGGNSFHHKPGGGEIVGVLLRGKAEQFRSLGAGGGLFVLGTPLLVHDSQGNQPAAVHLP